MKKTTQIISTILLKGGIILWILAISGAANKLICQENVFSDSERYVDLGESVQYRRGDIWFDKNNLETLAESESHVKVWKNYDFENPPKNRENKNYLWLKIKSPKSRLFPKAALYIPSGAIGGGFEAYSAGRLIYKYGEIGGKTDNKFNLMKSHLIELPPKYFESSIFIRIYSKNPASAQAFKGLYFGSASSLSNEFISKDMGGVVFEIMFVFAGIVSIFVFAGKKPRNYLFLSLAAVLVGAGAKVASASEYAAFFAASPAMLYYIENIALFMFGAGVAAFGAHIASEESRAYVNMIFQANLIFAGAALALDLIGILDFAIGAEIFLFAIALELIYLIFEAMKTIETNPAAIIPYTISLVALFIGAVLDKLAGAGVFSGTRIDFLDAGLVFFSIGAIYFAVKRAAYESNQITESLEDEAKRLTEEIARLENQLDATKEDRDKEHKQRYRFGKEIKLLQSVLDASDEMILICDREGLIFKANRSAVEQLAGETELTGRPLEDFVKKFPAADYEELWQTVKANKSQTYDIKLLKPGKEAARVQCRADYIRLNGNEYISLINTDVEDLDKASADADLSRDMLRDYTSVADAWFWEVDAEGSFTRSSEACSKLLGFSKGEILNKTYSEIGFEGKEGLKWKDLLKAVSGGEIIKNYENWKTCKDGGQACLLTSAKPVFDSDGNLIAIRGVDVDVSETKYLAKSLNLAEETLRSLLDATSAAMLATSRKSGKPLYFNKTFLDLFKYSKDDIGEDFDTASLVADPQKYAEASESFDREGFISWFETKGKTKYGDEFIMNMSAGSMRYLGEEAVITSFVDISDQKEAEESVNEQFKNYDVATAALREAFVLYDADLQILGHNAKIEEMFGIDGGEIEGSNYDELVRLWAQRGDQTIEALEKAASNPIGDEPLEIKIPAKTGAGAITLLRKRIKLDERKYIAIFEDISESENLYIEKNDIETKLSAALESTSAFAFEARADGSVVDDRGVLASLGRAGKKISSVFDLADFAAGDDVKTLNAAFREIISGDKSHVKIIARFKNADGDELWHKLALTTNKFGAGGEKRIFGVFANINDIYSADDGDKNDIEIKLSAALESISVFVFEALADGSVVDDRGVLASLGRTGKKISNVFDLADFAAGDDVKALNAAIREIISGDKSRVKIIARFKNADGDKLWHKLALSTNEFGASGEKRIFGVFANIDDIYSADNGDKIDVSGAAEMTRDIYLETDSEGKLTYLNQAGFDILSYAERDMERGVQLLDIAAPEERDVAYITLKNLLSENERIERDLRLEAKNGSIIEVKAMFELIFDGEIPVGIRCLMRDEREKSRLEKTLASVEEEARKKTKIAAALENEIESKSKNIERLSDELRETHNYLNNTRRLLEDGAEKIRLAEDKSRLVEDKYQELKRKYDDVETNLFLEQERMYKNQEKLEKIESELADYSAMYRSLAENSLQGLLVLTGAGCVSHNSSAEKISGLDADAINEISVENFCEYLPENEAEICAAKFREIFEGTVAGFKRRLHFSTENGEYKAIDAKFSKTRHKGKVALQVVFSDAAALEELERSAKALEKARDELFDGSPLAIMEFDMEESLEFLNSVAGQTNEPLGDYLRANPEIVAAFVSRLDVLSLNRRAEETFGVSGASELCSDLPAMFDKEALQSFAPVAAEIQFGARQARFETAMKIKSNKKFFSLFIKIAGSKAIFYLRDIDDEKRAEMEIEKLRAQSQIIGERSFQGVIVSNPPKWYYANKIAEEITGYSFEELKNFTHTQTANFIHPDDLDDYAIAALDLKNGRAESLRMQYRILHKSGEYKRIDSFMNRIEYNGKPAIQSVFIDISEIARAAKIFFGGDPASDYAVENMPLPILTVNSEGEILKMNKKAVEDLLVQRGDNISDIFVDGAFDVAKIAAKGELSELQCKAKTKTIEAAANAVAIPSPQENGEVELSIALFYLDEIEDIRERLQSLEKEFIEGGDINSKFLANVNTSVKNPLNLVVGYAELLASIAEEGDQKRYAESILKGGVAANAFVDDLVELAKIERGAASAEPEFVDTREFFNEIADAFQMQATEKNVELAVEVSKNFPDEIEIKQPLMRLIVANIISFLLDRNENGSIRISAGERMRNGDKKIDMTIAIEGQGADFDEQDVENIFEPFMNKTVEFEGANENGLKMHIARKIVGLLEGAAAAQSEPGVGAIIDLAFFDIAYRSKLESGADVAGFLPDFEGFSFMIAAAEEESAEALREILSRTKAEVVCARKPEEVVKLAEKAKPQLIFMDIALSNGSTESISKKIKEMDELSDIPLVALTSSIIGVDKTNILKNFNSFILKPVTMDDLFGEINYFIEKSAAKS